MTDEIKRTFIVPAGMTFKSWCETEYLKIRKKFEYKVTTEITEIRGCNLRFTVTLIDYETKRIGVSDNNVSFEVGAVKAFYDYKGWKLPKEQKKIKLKDLKYGEYFTLPDYPYGFKFICIEDNFAITKNLKSNIITVHDKEYEVVRYDEKG